MRVQTNSKAKVRVTREAFTTEAAMPDNNGAAFGRFANGYVAIVWRVGRWVHAKLYDKAGNEIGSQYGKLCTYFTKWSFPKDGIDFDFNVVGPTK